MVSKIRKLEGDNYWIIYQSTTDALFEHLFSEREGAEEYLKIYEEYWDKSTIIDKFDVRLRIIGRSICKNDIVYTWKELLGETGEK